jgi:periplasmic divalent cation tolerance protein
MPQDPEPIELVLTTEADAAHAERLARQLVEEGLAACVSWQPLRSLYRWQGAIESSDEVQLLIKTGAGQLASLQRRLLERHSYDTPEWIHWSAAAEGSYADWLRGSLSPGVPAPAEPANPAAADPAG